ncbi:MAG: sigma-70 family RNA polymerase sigma factor [Myxococcota bacterium]
MKNLTLFEETPRNRWGFVGTSLALCDPTAEPSGYTCRAPHLRAMNPDPKAPVLSKPSAATSRPPDTLEERIAEARRQGDLARAMTLGLHDYGPELLGFIHALVRDEDLARDIYAELSARLWAAFPRFEGRSSFRTWAYRAARNLAIGTCRARRDVQVDESFFGTVPATRRTTTVPFRRTTNKDRLSALRRTLSPEEQALLTLRLDRQMSWSEIAAVHGDDTNSESESKLLEARLRKRFGRLKDKLRTAAIREGWV